MAQWNDTVPDAHTHSVTEMCTRVRACTHVCVRVHTCVHVYVPVRVCDLQGHNYIYDENMSVIHRVRFACYLRKGEVRVHYREPVAQDTVDHIPT